MWNRQLQMVGLSKSHLQEERKTDCQPFIPTVFFWALQVLWRWYQRRRWGCRPAGSLAQLSPGEVELSVLLSDSVHCVAEAGWCQLDQFERSKFRIVPRFANLVAMFGQFVRRCVFFWMLRQLSRLFLWQHLATLKGHKCEIDSCKGSDMQELLARGAATDCRPFIPTVLFWAARCFDWDTKGADGAADLLEVLRNSPLEKLNFEKCAQIPSTAWQKLRGASWTNLREANFSWCLVLQTWLRCLASSLDAVFFQMLRPLSWLFLWQHLATVKSQKMWNRQLQMVRHAKVTCKRSGNRLPSFSPHSLLFSTPGALTMAPKAPMGPQTCWKSCGTLPWRSWTLTFAL